jgi:hypothetical protein
VSSSVREAQVLPSVASLGDRFFVVWAAATGDGTDVIGRMFSDRGEPLSEELVLSTSEQGDQVAPDVSSGGGSFLATWADFGANDGEGSGIRARSISRDGELGEEWAVNTTIAGEQDSPVVAGTSDGRFFIAWEDNGVSSGDPNPPGTRGRSSRSAPVSSIPRIDRSTPSSQANKTIPTSQPTTADSPSFGKTRATSSATARAAPPASASCRTSRADSGS